MYERTVSASKSDGIVYFHDVILAMHPSFEKFAVILKKRRMPFERVNLDEP